MREAWEVISTLQQLDALPVGSVVMALWDEAPLHFVAQRYSDGWYGFPNSAPCWPQFPLGSARNGEKVLVLWHPAWTSGSETAECARCHRLGYIDAQSGWCQTCLHGTLPGWTSGSGV